MEWGSRPHNHSYRNEGKPGAVQVLGRNTRSLAETSKDLAEGSSALAQAVMANTGSAADSVTTTKTLARAVEANTKSNEKIASSLPKHIVRRYVFVRRSGEETILALAGFKTGQHQLSREQQDWLDERPK